MQGENLKLTLRISCASSWFFFTQ